MTKRPRIGVVGSSNIDLVTYVERMPVWGETIAAPRFEMNHGGKGANQAVAAAKLGAEVVMVSKVGDDMLGDGVISNFKETNVGAAHVRNREHVHQRQQIDVVAGPTALSRDLGAVRTAHFRAHEEIEAVVDIIGSEAVLPLRLSLNVLAIGMNVETVGALVKISAAARKEHVVAAVGILQDEHHCVLARWPGPK